MFKNAISVRVVKHLFQPEVICDDYCWASAIAESIECPRHFTEIFRSFVSCSADSLRISHEIVI